MTLWQNAIGTDDGSHCQPRIEEEWEMATGKRWVSKKCTTVRTADDYKCRGCGKMKDKNDKELDH